MILDDYFPSLYGQPCFSKNHGKEIWVLLIEKMWAKQNRDYVNIEGGFMTETLHDLTGAPTKLIYNDD